MVSKMSGDVEIKGINVEVANPALDGVIKNQSETDNNAAVQNKESTHLDKNVAAELGTVQAVDQEKGMSKSPFLDTFVVTELGDRKIEKEGTQNPQIESASKKILDGMLNDPIMGPIIARILLPSPIHSQNSGSEVSGEEFVASQKSASDSQQSQFVANPSEKEAGTSDKAHNKSSKHGRDDADTKSSGEYYSSGYYSEEEDYEYTYSYSSSNEETVKDQLAAQTVKDQPTVQAAKDQSTVQEEVEKKS